VLLNELAGNGASDVTRDPMCGRVIDLDTSAPTVVESGVSYAFCSNDCRRHFLTRGLARQI
jgi:YHS domain-containing protein